MACGPAELVPDVERAIAVPGERAPPRPKRLDLPSRGPSVICCAASCRRATQEKGWGRQRSARGAIICDYARFMRFLADAKPSPLLLPLGCPATPFSLALSPPCPTPFPATCPRPVPRPVPALSHAEKTYASVLAELLGVDLLARRRGRRRRALPTAAPAELLVHRGHACAASPTDRTRGGQGGENRAEGRG